LTGGSPITAKIQGGSPSRAARRDYLKEIWKPVIGYEGFYEASNLGNIRSLKRATTSGRVLKQHVNKRNGYCTVSLSKNNVIKCKRVHKLVYMAFHPDKIISEGYNKYETIDHVDGNKTNNRIENLNLCTQSENQLRAYRLGINGKTTRKVIDLTTGNVFESCIEAAKSVGVKNLHSPAVTRVCKGERSQYRNHKFAYYDDFIKGIVPEFKGRAKKSCEKLWRK
jgi:hypothetical protein